MAFASARRDWARYRRGECDLIPALSYFAFGCVTVIVALMAVLLDYLLRRLPPW